MMEIQRASVAGWAPSSVAARLRSIDSSKFALDPRGRFAITQSKLAKGRVWTPRTWIGGSDQGELHFWNEGLDPRALAELEKMVYFQVAERAWGTNELWVALLST
jgi:hypothetical protein